MSQISGEMVKEKAKHIQEVEPDYLIGCRCQLFNQYWRSFKREGSAIKVLHIAEVLMSNRRKR